MTFDAKAAFAGLVTATAETTGQPSGLRIADNVTLRKEGALTPRPVSASTALARAYSAAFPYKGGLWYVNILGGTNLTYYGPNEASIAAAGVTLLPVRNDVFSAREARGNLYVTSLQGVYKVFGSGPWGLAQTGLAPNISHFRTVSIAAATSDDLLTAGQQVAYRLVTVWTDVNGVIIRSRPTGAIIAAATAIGSPVLLVGYSATSPSYVAKQVVELYRSRVFPTTAQIDDEMQLVYTFTPPTTSSGTFTFTDKVPDIRRGVTLYTSPSRGGIENANDRPPGCACLERFRSSLFFGNTVGPQRIVISYKVSTANLVGVATGLGTRGTTGTIAAGSNQITAVGSTVGVQIGQVVASQANVFTTPPPTVTAIAGSTVTVSAPFPNAQTAQPVSFYDAISLDGSPIVLGGGGVHGVALTTQPTTSVALLYSGLGGVYTAYEITPPAPGYDQTVVIERILRGGAAFQVRASHGDETNPALPLGNAASGTLSTNDVLTHGLAWSEPDEPEHTPPKNFARVGDAGRAILALVATKDRLLVFKEDGLFMLTGDTAKNFALYPLDTTCLCILPGSVRRLKNTVFLLSNLGLVAVDDSGSVSVVSRPIQLEVASIVNAIRAAQKASGLYNMPGLTGVTGAGDDAQGEYHLALGSSTPSFGGQVLVYSLPRDGFTTFSYGSPAPVALATDGEGNPLVLTASSLLTPTTALGAVLARVSPRAFADPALVGKFWTHITAGFSQLTGTTSVQARFTSSEAQVDTSLTETLESGPGTTVFNLPLGSLLRHPVPARVRRAYLLFVELLIDVATGSFTLETIAAEAGRENIPNKPPSHGSGAT